jgi:glycosyltransferase involved in cell wall biosynthesis
MPVFNGANYVAAAIESILAQSFADFELVICDNASTDATGEICAGYAARDPRVRYVRNPCNIGAGPNFDRCFHLAQGTYFHWAAHDDLLAPDFLARAVAALERRPEAVLCSAGIVEIDAEGAVLRRYATALGGCYRALLRWWFTDGHFADVVRDLLSAIHPHLLRAARAGKRAALGEHRDMRPGSLPRLER